jgi:ATP-dependent Clp protease, protease subunit
LKKILSFIVTMLLSTAIYALPLKPSPLTKVDKVNIDPERLTILKGPIDMNSSHNLVEDLRELDLNDPKKPIYLVIDSPGGLVRGGEDIIEEMQSLDSPLICIIDRAAYSMAAIISTYCPTLYVYKFATIMFHEASYGIDGNETNIKVRQAAIQKDLNQLHADVAKNLGLSLKDYKAKIHDEWWMVADEAVKMGFATAVLDKLKYDDGRLGLITFRQLGD